MKNSKVLKMILFISGLIAAGVGAALLFVPVAFYASSGIVLNGDINSLNEIRAGGGGLLAIGILILSGVFVAKLTYTATVLTILIYLAYGLSRILGMSIDGMPVAALMQATVLEIIIGLLGIFALLKYQEHE